jgi:MFS family permease
VFSAFFLGNLLGVVAAGYEADRKGPARPFLAGLALFALGLLGAGLAPNMVALVAARAVQGVGAGALPAVAYIAIGRSYPKALQPRMFAVLSSAWVLPGLIGPAISGAIAEAFGWRWVFLGLLPLVALAAIMTTRALVTLGAPGGGEPADRRIEALTLVAGAALVLAGASAHSVLATPILLVAGGIVGARAFTRLVPTGTLRLAPGLPAAVALRGLATFAFFGTDAYVSYTVTSVRHSSIALGGIALTAATLTWTTGSWVQERRVRRLGPQVFVRVGMFLIACGIGLMIAVAESVVRGASPDSGWASPTRRCHSSCSTKRPWGPRARRRPRCNCATPSASRSARASRARYSRQARRSSGRSDRRSPLPSCCRPPSRSPRRSPRCDYPR